MPIKTGAVDYSSGQEGELSPAKTVPPVPLLVLESALEAEVPLLSGENDISTGEEVQAQVSTENLLSLLDLMAEGKNATAMDNSSSDNRPATPFTTDAFHSDENREDQGEQAGVLFLEWIRDSIEDGTLSVNEKDSLLHVLAQFVFVVSPACFYRYITTAGGGDKDKARLQKSFEALNVHHSRNGKGLFHYHQYDTPDKSGRFTKVSGYMINADIIFKKGSSLSDSIWLSAKK